MSKVAISGNIDGLKPSQRKRLDRLASRRCPTDLIISQELARAMTEFSFELNQQIGFLIDRRGHIRELIVGDARTVFLPDLSKYRRGRERFCGLRLIHTHLHDGALDEDDFTDLALLRLDLVCAIQIQNEGLPGKLHYAHIVPSSEDDKPWEVYPPTTVYDLKEDYLEMIAALEQEHAQKIAARKTDSSLADKAILLHISEERRPAMEESIAELVELTESAGIEVVHEVLQRRKADPRSVIGTGKLKTIIIKSMQLGAESLIFDVNLTPTQVKSLSNITDMKILDRTMVILDIFAQRAETREGKIQVELAQLRYMLPHLSSKHTAMSRLTGGIGGRGPGETKLELNRRRAQDRIAQLQREVNKLGDRRRLRRSRRTDKKVPTVAIVGYTNAGKSTLLNHLTKSEVTAKDALFATLNPVSRRLRFPKEREIIITDTVGFIRNLPVELKEAFKTTFEEMVPANLLLHVLDASNPDVEHLYEAVNGLLEELEFHTKPALVILNKIDQCSEETIQHLIHKFQGIPVCALDRNTFTPLMETMETLLWREESDDGYKTEMASEPDELVAEQDAI